MKECVFLLWLCCFCWRTEADSRTYLITAPVSLRLDADETVFVELFGYTDDVRVFVYLKTSMAPDHVELSKDDVILNLQNKYKATAKLRIFPNKLDQKAKYVVLHVLSDSFNHHMNIPVRRSNGFLFIQTDKPLYTPHQKVNVRVFSMNQELRPAKRNVFLTFRDPDKTIVDVVEMADVNNGVPTMQNPFVIPVKPKLGIWTIEASYSNDFTTNAKADFEVREYVLPSFTIHFEPRTNFITYSHFQDFSFKVSARYLHGAPVADGELFLRYGYVGSKAPVIITTSVTRKRLSSEGRVDVTLNMQDVLKNHDGPKDLDGLVGKYLYVTVLLTEDTGGITQEAEFASVKFVKSPYHLSLISTPPFIKPGLPYNIQVLVRDHLNKPVSEIPVRLVEEEVITDSHEVKHMTCQESTATGSSGLSYFICNPLKNAATVKLKFETAEDSLPRQSQASLELKAEAYHSPNRRYLYINTPMFGRGLVVDQYSNIQVYTSAPSFLQIKTISYLVISKGKVVHHDSQPFVASIDNVQNLNFLVTNSMVPSIRLLVYYILHGEGTSELVADSVWLDVKAKCINGLNVELNTKSHSAFYKPREELHMNINVNRDGVVALSAVDAALFSLRPNYRDPVSMVLRHIEQSDMGCGGGGGKNNSDVFRLAGLTFMTNANADPVSSSEPCTAVVRAKRAVTEEQKREMADSYGKRKPCCEQGMRYIPKSVTCEQFANQAFRKSAPCREAFRECCEFIQKGLDLDDRLVLGRHHLGANFDQAPALVRSYFPESWLWEAHEIRSGQMTIKKSLPDSLTTWEIKTIGMFENGGMCVADPVKVSVNLPLSVDIPLPYQVVRGEQVQLQGSVYNQLPDTISYCVTLMAGQEVCLLQSELVEDGKHATPCNYKRLSPGGVATVSFTVLGLEPGLHTLRFTLKTPEKNGDIVEKKLRVVPDGVRQEVNSGGRLDPQGIYGSEKIEVELKNKLPENMVPSSGVQRVLTINGELPGEVVTVISNPKGFRQLISTPEGSAMGELERLLPYVQVYDYLEATRNWGLLGPDILKSSADMRQKIKDGQIAITSFLNGDNSYSMWRDGEGSTRVTAEVVGVLSSADAFVRVDHQSLSNSVSWLINSAQQQDGSFAEKSSYKSDKAMGSDPLEQSVYLTSFVLIALVRATSIRENTLQLKSHGTSKTQAADYISQHAPQVKSVYVRAVATYALTLVDSSNMAVTQLFESLEKVARQKGNPVELRYWQEPGVTTEWIKPDESSGRTVEMTAYVLLAVLNMGRIPYGNPILLWLTQDQHYGEGYFSMRDAMLTLEALTKYSKVVPKTYLNQDIIIRYAREGRLKEVQLNQNRPVSSPLEIKKNDDIIVSTGFGKGVSSVKLKTVYYQTTASTQPRCNFELTIKVVGPDASDNPSMRAPHLVACAKYKPPPGEKYTESELTVMKIQLPTGVEPYLEDLKQFKVGLEPVINDYSLEGSTVVIQIESVPSSVFLCVGFRIRSRFKVLGGSESLLTVTEPNDKGSICTRPFSDEQQKLQRLCVGEHCQCMTAACAIFRENLDTTLTYEARKQEICKPPYKYAFKVKVTSKSSEGDFTTYRTTVVEAVFSKDQDYKSVHQDTTIDLVKKASCLGVELKVNQRYMLIGSSGSEYKDRNKSKYRVALDSDTLVETWPINCESPECSDYLAAMSDLAINLELDGCDD
ncbi:complement C5 isoform X2 [Melanotaenia boesemani]|uniref:complement C5 isoform X2 n=1 Tax=Melanotaenia boesemani TaxID=1250792 RepID=UPI001C057753|nr:complement C5 isoform X2 [Melanotaenia boesemani]